MKKDIVIAIVVGFLLGVAGAVTLVNLPNLLQKREVASDKKTTDASLSPTPASTTAIGTLEINNPTDETISDKKSIEIEGKTGPGNIVVGLTDTEGVSAIATNEGFFKLPVTLAEGGNLITISSYNEKSEVATKTLTIFYTSESL